MQPALSRRSLNTVPRAGRWLEVFFVAAVLLAAAIGCRSGRDNQFDILESELRTQEDYIYELEDYLAEYSEKLRQCRRSRSQPSAKKRSTLTKPELVDDRAIRKLKQSQADRADKSPRRSAQSNGAEPERTDSIPDPSEIPELEPEELIVPELEIDEPAPSQGANLSAQVGDPPSEPVLLIPDPVDYDSTASEAIPFVQTPTVLDAYDSLPVTVPAEQPVLESPFADATSEQFSQEADLVDGPAEASGVPDKLVITEVFRDSAVTLDPNSLLTVVEARNADDEPIKFAGEATVLVLVEGDPSQQLARWDFTAAETADAWQASYLGDGLHLELPLNGKSLPETPLEVWVQLVTQDGQELLSKLPIRRADLLALDPASGAESLEPSEHLHASDHTSLPTAAGQPADRVEEETQAPRWRSSTQFVEADQGGYSSTASNAPGKWASQPPGGRYSAAPRTAGRKPPLDSPSSSVSANAKRPAWTATRLDRDGKPTQRALQIPDPAANDSKPHWVPYR